MKAYLHYLTLPDEDVYEDYFKCDVVKDFMVVHSCLNKLIKRYDSSKNEWYYLYAITDDKTISEMFSSIHDSSLFTVMKKSIDKDEFNSLKKENYNAVLSKYKYNEYDEDDKRFIIMTRAEKIELDDMSELWLEQELFDSSDYEYDFLQKEYIEALDFLMYCLENRLHGPDSLFYAESCLGYGVSAEGYARARIVPNIEVIYCRLFRMLLKKG